MEIIVELLFEGGFEGVESDSTPMGLRIVLATIMTAIYIALIVVLVMIYIEDRTELVLAITIILGIFFAYFLGRMWFRIVKRLRKR